MFTSPSVPSDISVTDEETKVKTHKMEKNIEMILSKLEIKDLEMEVLSAEVKMAYATIELLQKRVSELEFQKRECNIKSDSQPTTSCLLLGDSNNHHVLRSDLAKNCTVRTINMATFDKLREWVAHKLTPVPSTCVINCGLYDMFDDLSPEVILDNVGSLISDLKDKFNSMKIYVCTIAPAPVSCEVKCKIENYTEQLEKWADANGVTLVHTSPMFKLSTGDVDELCFNTERDTTPLILNRLGAIRLLDAIDKQCPEFQLCSNWIEVKRRIASVITNVSHNKVLLNSKKDKQQHESRQYNPSHPKPLLTTNLNSVNYQYAQPPYSYSPLNIDQVVFSSGQVHADLPHPSSTTLPPSRPHYPQPPPSPPLYSQPPPRSQHHTRPSHHPPIAHSPSTSYASIVSNSTVTPHQNGYTPSQGNVSRPQLGTIQYRAHVPKYDTRRPSQSHRSSMRSLPPHTSHYTYNTRAHTNYVDTSFNNNNNVSGKFNMYNKKVGYFNCGEFNHVQANCRFDHKLQCQQCLSLGHKSRLCSYYC